MRTLDKQSRRRMVLAICLVSLAVSASATAVMLFVGQNPPLWLWAQVAASWAGAVMSFK
jgi:hypothetical protein